MADAADFLFRGDLHGSFGHMCRCPELVLIAVGIGEINNGPLVAVGSGADWTAMRNLVLIESAQVRVDILGADVEAAPRQILTGSFGRRVDLGLKERADAARPALPPEKGGDFNISLSRRGGESDERSASQADGIHRPVNPGGHIVRAHYKVIDPMNCAAGFDVIHIILPQFLVKEGSNRSSRSKCSNRCDRAFEDSTVSDRHSSRRDAYQTARRVSSEFLKQTVRAA